MAAYTYGRLRPDGAARRSAAAVPARPASRRTGSARLAPTAALRRSQPPAGNSLGCSPATSASVASAPSRPSKGAFPLAASGPSPQPAARPSSFLPASRGAAHLLERPLDPALHRTQRQAVAAPPARVRPAPEGFLHEQPVTVVEDRQSPRRHQRRHRVGVGGHRDLVRDVVLVEVGGHRPRTARPQAREAEVAGQGVEVRAHGSALGVEPVSVLPQPVEGVVEHLLRLLAAAEHARGQGQHQPAVPLVELAERGLVAASQRPGQFDIAHGGIGHGLCQPPTSSTRRAVRRMPPGGRMREYGTPSAAVGVGSPALGLGPPGSRGARPRAEQERAAGPGDASARPRRVSRRTRAAAAARGADQHDRHRDHQRRDRVDLGRHALLEHP